jgi:hypothetical protein
MALCTRAQVLQRIGLVDDAVTNGAIAISLASGVTNFTLTKTGNTLSIESTGVVDEVEYDLTDPANDTMGELVSLMNARSSMNAELVSGVASGLASSLLVDVTLNLPSPSTDNVTILNYTNVTNNTTAALIDALIEECDAAIARHCNRYNRANGAEEFSSGSRTETYDGTGSSALLLRSYPVTAVTSVVFLDEEGNVSQTLASTDYKLNAATGTLHLARNALRLGNDGSDGRVWSDAGSSGPYWQQVKNGWPEGRQNIRVVYTGGYATIPSDLRGVAIDSVVTAYLNRRNNMRVASESGVGASASYLSIDQIVAQRADLLALHKRYVL